MLKKQLFTLLAIALMLAGCQSKTKTAEVIAEEKACCSAGASACCSGKTSENEITQVVYFHNERRCATCMAVEEVTNEVIAPLDTATISFHSYEIGQAECAQLVADYEIAGQTLLIIGKDTTIDLTNSAFMNARVNPDRFKADLMAVLEKI